MSYYQVEVRHREARSKPLDKSGAHPPLVGLLRGVVAPTRMANPAPKCRRARRHPAQRVLSGVRGRGGGWLSLCRAPLRCCTRPFGSVPCGVSCSRRPRCLSPSSGGAAWASAAKVAAERPYAPHSVGGQSPCPQGCAAALRGKGFESVAFLALSERAVRSTPPTPTKTREQPRPPPYRAKPVGCPDVSRCAPPSPCNRTA